MGLQCRKETDARCKRAHPLPPACWDVRFRGFLARREGFEPPAFWSVGCPEEKTEPFRLRFKLFTAVCWMDSPLFPSSFVCSNSILGQKWVKISSQAVFGKETGMICDRVRKLRKKTGWPLLTSCKSCGRIIHKFYGTIYC